jgi:putative ABC transport system permease protein
MCWNTGFFEQIHIRLQAAPGEHVLDLPKALQTIEGSWKQHFPQDVYQYAFLNESLAKGYVVEKLE